MCKMVSGENTIFSKNYTATVVNIKAVNDDFGKKLLKNSSKIKLHSKNYSISYGRCGELTYISFMSRKDNIFKSLSF